MAVTVVAIAVVVASSAIATSALESFSAESSNPNHFESKKADPSTDINEASVVKAALDEHVDSFKEFFVEDSATQQATGSKEWDEMSFGEKAREVGASVAHKALDEVTDLVKVVPQLCEEAKELATKFLPESVQLPNAEDTESPIENYENFLAKSHKVIDSVFSTDQAELFTTQARANDPMNNFAIGMIPLPGSFNKIFLKMEVLRCTL